ncbi:hypothetical protein H696_04066 [Fonticula alba]|uniref:Fe2OG dioxygenase domain-containing protein n=1 Tax=Fonticula alba TaxID=691883 RepID=A0A058Z6A4_FONAL|nr:hypothetical protein H696_04066 [Fonticula alba]KCV69651.1 hypothetical protein H696_04066 [Fonticula alba]|eukprot:XP_009496216.1 hypothetical protein H696_04066 [Fonticula alba]
MSAAPRMNLRSKEGFEISVAAHLVDNALLRAFFLIPGDVLPCLIDTKSLAVYHDPDNDPPGVFAELAGSQFQVVTYDEVYGSDDEAEHAPAAGPERRPIDPARIEGMKQALDAYVQRHYTPAFPQILAPEFAEQVGLWAAPELLRAFQLPVDARLGPAAPVPDCPPEHLLRALLKVESTANFLVSLPVFRLDFCALLAAEIRHFNEAGMPTTRPNSMNKYGLALLQLGLDKLMDTLMKFFLGPLSKALFGDAPAPAPGPAPAGAHGPGCHPQPVSTELALPSGPKPWPNFNVAFPAAAALDFVYAFAIQYNSFRLEDGRPAGDVALDPHTDDSHVTLNACVGDFQEPPPAGHQLALPGDEQAAALPAGCTAVAFTGGDLMLLGVSGAPGGAKPEEDQAVDVQNSERLSQAPGHGQLHLGAVRHAALPIDPDGRRSNVVLWMRNTAPRCAH